MTKLDLQEALQPSDRDIVIVALQALWRERVAGYNSAATVAELRGTNPPDREAFGIEEARVMLERFGAAPM